MEPLTIVESRAVPVMNANIDTDIITPMQRLTGNSDKPLAHYAFEPLRYVGGDGDTGEPDPDFALNQPQFAEARIMLCGENFGCGSSRESAPRAIADLGYRCLIGTSFGDIFFNNCFQQGILPIVLDAELIEALLADAREGKVFRVDLSGQTITVEGNDPLPFWVNGLRKKSLMEGLDDIGITLTMAAEIDEWQARDRERRPWVWPATSFFSW